MLETHWTFDGCVFVSQKDPGVYTQCGSFGKAAAEGLDALEVRAAGNAAATLGHKVGESDSGLTGMVNGQNPSWDC